MDILSLDLFYICCLREYDNNLSFDIVYPKHNGGFLLSDKDNETYYMVSPSLSYSGTSFHVSHWLYAEKHEAMRPMRPWSFSIANNSPRFYLLSSDIDICSNSKMKFLGTQDFIRTLLPQENNDK